MSIEESAEKEGKHVIDALLDLVVVDDLQTEFRAALQGRDIPKYTAEVLRSMYTMPGLSDGGAHVKFSTGGRFPTELLVWLVRDEKVVSLEEAHYKLSYVPAFFGGFKDRGFLRESAPADIVVYDMERLGILPTEVAYDLPGGDWRRIQRAGRVPLDNSERHGNLRGREADRGPTRQAVASWWRGLGNLSSRSRSRVPLALRQAQGRLLARSHG